MDPSDITSGSTGRAATGSGRVTVRGPSQKVPDFLETAPDITSLALTDGAISVVPEYLGTLTSLRSLDLSGNQLRSVPDSLGNLTGLTELNLSGNGLREIPDAIGRLTALIRLNLGTNPLPKLPAWLQDLTALSKLDLSDIRLTQLPGWLGDIPSLTVLDLSFNDLSGGLDPLGRLESLTALDLSVNQLAEVRGWLGNLTALTSLDLSTNGLHELPEVLGNLTRLKSLDLSGNRLARLPGQLGYLSSLTTLDVSDNRLEALPPGLADFLVRGLNLRMHGNPLVKSLPEVVKRGADELATYLRSLHDGAPQYEAKLIVVGDGNVGKTSLVAAVKGQPFVPGRPTTHGIEISPISLRHPGRDLDMTLRAWDFGGQEVYHVTHPFFFSPRALYLVVWHARQGQDQDEVGAWLRRIHLRVGDDACTLVVATHCQDREPELDYPQLEQAFPAILNGACAIDSRTGDGVAALCEAISARAAELPQMGQLISPRWIAAREEVLARAADEPQMGYDRFTQICERHGVTGAEISTLAKLMHDLGLIIYFAEDEGLRDVVVLDPEWLTKAISYVLEDHPTRQARGVLDHARLKEIWHDRQDGYDSSYHKYFLRLMEKFDISYRLDSDQLHSLVAQMVPHERPALPWQATTDLKEGTRALRMICRMSEPVPGLISWLTVRHQRASVGAHWRRGVFLRHPIAAYASEALIELHGTTDLAVEARAPSPDLYFNVLRDSIEDLLAHRWPGLAYQLLMPCPGAISGTQCSGQFPLDGLLRVREQGEVSRVACMTCGMAHHISVLLTGFAVETQPLTAAIDHMQGLLASVKDDVSSMRPLSAEIAETVRRVQRVVSTEVTDCPRLFTLAPVRPAGIRQARVHQRNYRLTLWCEHPGQWHPREQAGYDLGLPADWFAQAAPYIKLIVRTLQLAAPLAGAITAAVLPPDQQGDVKARLDVMNALIADLPASTGRSTAGTGLGQGAGELTLAEGAGLRALRSTVFEHDPHRAFGGMRRVQAPSGDLMWVCPDHYPEYDPGLPMVP
jgi:internalin A